MRVPPQAGGAPSTTHAAFPGILRTLGTVTCGQLAARPPWPACIQSSAGCSTRKGGVVTSAQALAFLTRRGLEAHVNRGALQKIWYCIYGRGEVTTALRLRGLDVAAGTTVAACMGTAAAAYGFDTERTADLHVLNPGGRQLRSTDGLLVHRRAGAPLTVVAGRPATAPAWTAIEVARGLRRHRALATLDAALRSGTCSRGDLDRAVDLQSGRRGIVTTVAEFGFAACRVAHGERGAAGHDRRWVAAAGPAIRDRGQAGMHLAARLGLARTSRRGRVRRRRLAQRAGRISPGPPTCCGTAGPGVVLPIVAGDVRYRRGELVRRLEARLERGRAA